MFTTKVHNGQRLLVEQNSVVKTIKLSLIPVILRYDMQCLLNRTVHWYRAQMSCKYWANKHTFDSRALYINQLHLFYKTSEGSDVGISLSQLFDVPKSGNSVLFHHFVTFAKSGVGTEIVNIKDMLFAIMYYILSLLIVFTPFQIIQLAF